ncbi:MAG: restriction endonuclease [Gammaproteobacteria bacterium]
MGDEDGSCAEKDWRLFERLAVRMVAGAFRLEPGMVLVTHQSRDGGYDGSVSHELATDDSVLGLLQELTFIEAKMRSGNGGIGLRDFAATLVIAHNEYANTLVVVANRPFTKQALEQACRFFSRTNMRVKLVDGATVSGWVRRNLSELSADFPDGFLRGLLLGEPDDECATRRVFDCQKHLMGMPIVPRQEVGRLVIETGWHDDETPADCELSAEATARSGALAAPAALIGRERRDTLDALTGALSSSMRVSNAPGSEPPPGAVCVLTGTGGVGKSVMVAHLLNRLADPAGATAWTGLIDVGRELSSRGLFVSILSALLGTDPRDLTSGDEVHWEPEALVARLVDGDATDPMYKAVARTLKSDLRDFESSWDLNVEPLLAYLGRVVARRSRHQPIALVFHELNRGTAETLDFLFQACRVLSTSQASVLVELRDSGYEETASGRRPGEAESVMPLEQWQQVVKRFRSLASAGAFHVRPLNDAEAVAYLQVLLPGLGDAQAGVICRHVGRVPLHLRLTADWHEAEGILARHDGGIFLVEDLERFFAERDITPRSVNTIFDHLIASWWGRPQPFYRRAITAVALFNGELPLSAIEVLAAPGDGLNRAEELIASGLFQVGTGSTECLEVSHDLVRERIDRFVKEHRLGIGITAQELLDRLDAIVDEPSKREQWRVNLLLELGSAHALEAARRAQSVARELAATRDWSVASAYFGKAAASLRARAGFGRDDHEVLLEITVLADWLDVEVLRYRIGSSENERRLSTLLDLLAFSPSLPISRHEADELGLRAAIIEWRYYYVHERFDDALRAAERGRELARQAGSDVDVEVRGKALSNHAVTLKVKDRRADSLRAFDEALALLPDSYTVIAERLSNIAAFALRDDPARALTCYRELLRITQGTRYSFSEIIHAHVDIAMADFLLGDLDAAQRDAQIAVKMAMDNAVSAEEARARNILGCTRWAEGDISAADRAFEAAAFASERSISHRFLWRMRTNAAGTALELGDRERAYGLARSAEDAIIGPRESAFARTGADPGHFTARWYVALIAIASRYQSLGREDDLERMMRRVRLPRFRDHCERVALAEFPDEVFAGTTHLRAGRIMITG